MTELKPCPWCGEAGRVYDDPHGPGKTTTWEAVCSGDCEAAGSFSCLTKDEAITAWNTRVPDPTLTAERDELVKALETARAELTDLRSFYGKNLQVADWHENGDLEPLDNFFDDNDHGAIELIDATLTRIKANGGDSD